MINTIVIDDEESSIELITNLLGLYCKNVSVLGTASSVSSGYESIVRHKPDLVMLDVQMRDGTGFDLLKLFDRISFKVIFITAHQEFAIEAFKFSALDYVQKPLSPLHLLSAIEKAEHSISTDDLDLKLKTLLSNISDPQRIKRRIVLKTQDRIYSVSTADISRLESDGNYTTVYLPEGKKIMVSRLLKEFEELLCEQGFMRVHQSHLVNIECLFCFEKSASTITMKDGAVIPVSSRKKDQLLQFINSV